MYDLDFDEDLNIGDNVENLKSMRERRRSIDYRHQSDSFRSRDASESPKFAAAANNQKLGKIYTLKRYHLIKIYISLINFILSKLIEIHVRLLDILT